MLITSYQMAVLDDPKLSADVNTAKGISLEHLGYIGAKIYKLSLTVPNELQMTGQDLPTLAKASKTLSSGMQARRKLIPL